MNATPIPAYRELDEEIARKVFGGPFEHVEWWWWNTADWPIGPLYKQDEIPDRALPLIYAGPHFSTDIRAAWMVVERCTALTPFAYRDVNGLPVATWFMAHFEKAHLWACTAEEAATMICYAAIAALDGRPAS